MGRQGGSIDHIDRTLTEKGKDSLAQKDTARHSRNQKGPPYRRVGVGAYRRKKLPPKKNTIPNYSSAKTTEIEVHQKFGLVISVRTGNFAHVRLNAAPRKGVKPLKFDDDVPGYRLLAITASCAMAPVLP